MKYEESIKKLASTSRSDLERVDVLIKEMCRLTNDLLDYKFAAENYKGKGTVLDDLLNATASSAALLIGDLDIYMEQMDITNKVKEKKEKRIDKLANKKGV